MITLRNLAKSQSTCFLLETCSDLESKVNKLYQRFIQKLTPKIDVFADVKMTLLHLAYITIGNLPFKSNLVNMSAISSCDREPSGVRLASATWKMSRAWGSSGIGGRPWAWLASVTLEIN